MGIFCEPLLVQEYIHDLEKEEEEQRKIQKVHLTSRQFHIDFLLDTHFFLSMFAGTITACGT